MERKRRLKLWNPALDIYQNALNLDIKILTAESFAKANKLKYKKISKVVVKKELRELMVG